MNKELNTRKHFQYDDRGGGNDRKNKGKELKNKIKKRRHQRKK